jgi:hypothetical protein
MQLDYTHNAQTIVQEDIYLEDEDTLELLLYEDLDSGYSWNFTRMSSSLDWEDPTFCFPKEKLDYHGACPVRSRIISVKISVCSARAGTIVIEKVLRSSHLTPLQTVIINLFSKEEQLS